MDKLPLYEMTISDDLNSEVEVSAIALVDYPAIEKTWQAFKDNKNPLSFATINEDEHLIVGPAMIPDLKIYRRCDELGEHNVVFSKETVCQIAEKFYAKGFQGKANIMHDQEQACSGVNYFLSWIKDGSKNMIGLSGDYPEGTWFVGARVSNPEVWAKIKSGEIKGFSVEGIFTYEKPEEMNTEEDTLLGKIKEILNGINP